MFKIGDKIVYPMHGAGIVKVIEEKEVLGEKHMYYVMKLKDMQVMLPIRSDVGVREIVDLTTLRMLLNPSKKKALLPNLMQPKDKG